MPNYNEPTKTNPSHTEPSKTNPVHTEPEKSDVSYVEPQWIEARATWENLKGITWKDIVGLTWKGLSAIFGNKISEPTYTETSKGTVNYTEPPKE